MSGTLMDTDPLLPSTQEPAPPAAEAVSSTSPGAALSATALPVTRGREFPVRDVFVGPHGLYAGTRWLIYLAMSWALFLLLGMVAHWVHPHRVGAIWWSMVSEAEMMLAAIVPGFAMARLEGQPFGDFGLPARGAFGRNFWVGTLWGIASLSVLMLALRLAGAFEFGALALRGSQIVKFGAYYILLFLLTGFFEEFALRGYSQWVLAKGMNFWPAAAVLSVGFGAIHSGNSGEAKTGLVAAGLIGFFFCLTLRRTGNLWWAVGFHMSWDWGESFLYSVPDSGGMAPGHLLNSSLHGPEWLTGGTVGPEGSYLVFVVIIVLWVVFDRMYPEVKYRA